MSTFNSRRRGFTLVECVVVLAIVVIGLALLTPAIQQSRAQAQRSQCKNNLKQFGLALHNYHETFGTFPPGWVAKVPTPGDGPRYGWLTFILPYVDHAPLYERMDFNSQLPAISDDKEQEQNTIPSKAELQMHLEVYRCPSDTTSDTNPMRGNYGTSNYSGNHGNLPLPRWVAGRRSAFWPGQVETPHKAEGITFWNSSIRLRDVTDGLSNTFLVGERCVTSAAGIWPGVGSNEYENDAVTECSHGSRLNQGPTSFSSAHPGGANFLMGDGRVIFVNDTVDSQPISQGDLGIYQRLANRHDGLPLGDF